MRPTAGQLLSIGIALSLLALPAAQAGPKRPGAPVLQMMQSQPAAADPLAGPQAPPPMPAAAPGQVPMPGQGQIPGQPPMPGQAGVPGAAQNAALPGQPAYPQPPMAEIPKPFHGSMSFETGNGKILTLTLPAANVYVADPKVAEVRPASATSLFVFGIGAGSTNIAAVDAFGRLLADYQITVHPSGFGAREAQGAISRLVPGSQVQVKAQGKGMMLTGAVANASDAAQAMQIARGYGIGDGGGPVDNQMTIASPTQVTLQVRIAEMKRSIVRNLGIDWSAGGFFGKIAPAGAAPGSAIGPPLLQASLNGFKCLQGLGCLDGVLNALAKDGLAHILAEPNLTVMSGQAASFQSGGEFPYQVLSGVGGSATATVAFKQYGVMLKFLPTVLSDGRINLHVAPEVSELDNTNTVQNTSSSTLSVPALSVRRAETTVEMGSGESLAIAGMLKTSDADNNAGLPGLGETPIFGSLFKTNSMSREQVELVIIVTPILVRPVKDPRQLQIPADGYVPANDINRLLLLRQMPNRDGTTSAALPGRAGFMVR